MKPSIASTKQLLLKVLSAQYKVLIDSGASKEVKDEYSRLLKYLRLDNCEFYRRPAKQARREHYRAEGLSVEQARELAVDEVEKMLSDKTVPRVTLELLAIERFSVPRGSMRQFSSRHLLTDKLNSLVQSEKTHQTISEVARSGERPA